MREKNKLTKTDRANLGRLRLHDRIYGLGDLGRLELARLEAIEERECAAIRKEAQRKRYGQQ